MAALYSLTILGRYFMKFDTSTVQTVVESPLGPVTLAATDRGLAGLWFAGQRHLPPELAQPPSGQTWTHSDQHAVLQQTAAQLAQYFAGQRHHFDLPLDVSGGTAFQQAVWQALRTITPGHTCTYSAISQMVGKPAAVRAVGAAIGRNPLSIVVPCHRVLGKRGSLTGYAGGLERKQALLRIEGVTTVFSR